LTNTGPFIVKGYLIALLPRIQNTIAILEGPSINQRKGSSMIASGSITLKASFCKFQGLFPDFRTYVKRNQPKRLNDIAK